MQRLDAREARFSPRTLRSYAATGLPQLFALRAAASAADAATEILLYDEIGYWGITAKEFVLALARVGDGPVSVRINSPGGDTFEGMAIYNALKARTAPVTVTVDGLAASAASLIAMAATDLRMAEASLMMIHNCWGFCVGNRNDMLEMAAVQEKIDGVMAAIYAGRSGKSTDEIAALMDAETWFTSTEAKAAGLANSVIAAPTETQAASRMTILARSGLRASLCVAAQALPPYDPDGDGDNDAEEAMGLINSAAVLLGGAMDALAGTEDDEGVDGGADAAQPMVPGARRRARAAATEPEWVVGADTGLPIDTRDTWDGPAAAERMLEAAGFNGNSPDPARAKRGFLVWDHHNPNLKGSYKLPFADVVDGALTAIKGGLDAAASRLPQTDIPTDVKARARDVLDAYEKRMSDESSTHAARQRRLRVAVAETA